MIQLTLDSEVAQEALGQKLASILDQACVIYLEGDLGAGKTTLARGLIKGLGHDGAVKSPTYAIVEPYDHLPIPCFHFDLYRLADPEELEYLGIRDMLNDSSILLFEWPDKAQGELPAADIHIQIHHDNHLRRLDVQGLSEAGHTFENKLKLIV